jgi:hypothetical protein
MSFSTSAIQLGGTLQLQERMSTKRSERDHQRYLENRDEILAKQKEYRDTNKEEIAARRRLRNFQKVYVESTRPPKKSRKECNRDYYLKNREKLLAKARQYYYEHKRKQNTTAGSERCAADCT